MAFNVNVRNFEQATEYFWSAPKEVLTQHRPGTWGQIYLQSKPANQTLPASLANNSVK
jgi:hypothetical protein